MDRKIDAWAVSIAALTVVETMNLLQVIETLHQRNMPVDLISMIVSFLLDIQPSALSRGLRKSQILTTPWMNGDLWTRLNVEMVRRFLPCSMKSQSIP